LSLLAACGSFGEADDTPPATPTPTDDAGPIADSDAGTEEVPEEVIIPGDPDGKGSTGTFCTLKAQDTSVVFCSDFDDPTDPWVGWSRQDFAAAPERYALDKTNFTSVPQAAKLTIAGVALSTPDARLRHNLKPATHISLNAQVRLSSPSNTDAVLLRLQFAKGSVYLRSTGAVSENIVPETGSTTTVSRLPATDPPPPQNKWLSVAFDLDFPTGELRLTVDGATRSAQVVKRQTEGPLLVVGPADPKKTAKGPGLDMWLDDFFVSAQ